MPGKDGTGPDGKSPKKTNQGIPTPRRVGGGGGKRSGNRRKVNDERGSSKENEM